MRSKLMILVFLVISLVQGASIVIPEEHGNSPEFLADQFYLCTYILLWGMAIDLSLFIVFKSKH